MIKERDLFIFLYSSVVVIDEDELVEDIENGVFGDEEGVEEVFGINGDEDGFWVVIIDYLKI